MELTSWIGVLLAMAIAIGAAFWYGLRDEPPKNGDTPKNGDEKD